MIQRRDQRRVELTEAARRTDASRRQADEEMRRARERSAADQKLADRLAELNASNGFAEILIDAVVRGAT